MAVIAFTLVAPPVLPLPPDGLLPPGLVPVGELAPPTKSVDPANTKAEGEAVVVSAILVENPAPAPPASITQCQVPLRRSQSAAAEAVTCTPSVLVTALHGIRS
jgi:hypothetical protein